jgi:hypothetical protein
VADDKKNEAEALPKFDEAAEKFGNAGVQVTLVK